MLQYSDTTTAYSINSPSAFFSAAREETEATGFPVMPVNPPRDPDGSAPDSSGQGNPKGFDFPGFSLSPRLE